MTPAHFEAIRAHTTAVLRARLAYRLQPTAVGKADCSGCGNATGSTDDCSTCQKARTERKRYARSKKK